MVVDKGMGVLVLRLDFASQPLGIDRSAGTLLNRRVPVRHLQTNEHTHNNDQEINRNGRPFLVPHMLDDAAEDHEARFRSSASSSRMSSISLRYLVRIRW